MPFFPFELTEVPGCDMYAPRPATSSMDHGLGAKTTEKMSRTGGSSPAQGSVLMNRGETDWRTVTVFALAFTGGESFHVSTLGFEFDLFATCRPRRSLDLRGSQCAEVTVRPVLADLCSDCV